MQKVFSNVMRVPRFTGNQQIDFIEKAVPTPGPGQLLIEVKANALCGTDREQFFHGSQVTPGHEAAGIVAASGPDTQTPVGTPGVIFLMDYCGTCRSCRQGLTNQCLHKRGDMGFNKDGGYGLYELIHENIFFPVDSDLSLTDATLLPDIMGTGGHAVRRSRLVHPDIESVVVTGAGPIGLAVLAMTKLVLGQEMPVVISDVSEDRLQLAERLGGKPVNLQEMTLAEGACKHGISSFDLAVDSSGKGAARQSSLQLLAQRGVQICVGHGEDLHLQVSQDLISTERAVLGSEYFGYRDFADNLTLLRQNQTYLRQIITHTFPVRFVQDELCAVGREHIAAELFVESVEETPYSRVLHSEGEPNVAGDFLRAQERVGERCRTLERHQIVVAIEQAGFAAHIHVVVHIAAPCRKRRRLNTFSGC